MGLRIGLARFRVRVRVQVGPLRVLVRVIGFELGSGSGLGWVKASG